MNAVDKALAPKAAVRLLSGNHACALAADPHILYWNPATLAAMSTVKGLRASGTAAFFTIDAGPHVKVLCRSVDAPHVQASLAATPGVMRVLVLVPGKGAHILNEN